MGDYITCLYTFQAFISNQFSDRTGRKLKKIIREDIIDQILYDLGFNYDTSKIKVKYDSSY